MTSEELRLLVKDLDLIVERVRQADQTIDGPAARALYHCPAFKQEVGVLIAEYCEVMTEHAFVSQMTARQRVMSLVSSAMHVGILVGFEAAKTQKVN